MDWLHIAFAGLWPLIWHYGIGGVLLLGCAAGWYFSPIHKVDFIYAAVIILAVMVSISIGVSLGEKRVQAQWDAAVEAAVNRGKQARIDGVHDAARARAHKSSRWLPATRDPDLRD